MTDKINTKPDTENQEPIKKIKLGKCSVTIIGTAHISKKSVETVQEIIRKEKPDTVCIELCDSRLASVRDPDHWKKLDIFKVFRQKKMWLLLSSLILSSFQKKLGRGEIRPGDEMRAAIDEGEKIKSVIITADREVQVTLKRAWGNVGLFSKMYLLSALLSSLLVKEEVSQEKIDEMKSEDVLKDLFSQLPGRYSSIKKVIIDERDEFLAEKIRNASEKSKKLVAVIGAGHLQGVLTHIENPKDISHLNEIPKPSWVQKLQYLVFPVLLIGLGIYTFQKSGVQAGTDLIYSWILVKGALAALGAMIAFAHPVSIVLAFLAAPFGNFNPVIKPGWIAALCESWLRKPLVEDFEKIAEDSEHFTGFWKNRVIRIFLVLILPQLGSSLGTFLVTYKGLKGVL